MLLNVEFFFLFSFKQIAESFHRKNNLYPVTGNFTYCFLTISLHSVHCKYTKNDSKIIQIECKVKEGEIHTMQYTNHPSVY